MTIPPVDPLAAPRRPWWRRPWLIAGALFSLTFLSTTLAGLMTSVPYSKDWIDRYGEWGALASGVKFSLPLMMILLAHELGHYLTARRYGIPASPPYFLPLPLLSPFGTLGAFIAIRQRIREKRVLFDIGAAGPFLGLLFALPFTIVGVHLSRVEDFSQVEAGLSEGDSLLYWLIKYLCHGALPPGHDILTHPLAMAGWFGLLITALNLLPVGQLDGGHIVYAWLGRRGDTISRLTYQFMWAMGCAGVLNLAVTALGWAAGTEILNSLAGWLVWGVVLRFLGVRHPPVDDDLLPLSPGRRILAALAVLFCLLCFTPIPLREIGAGAIPM